MLDTDTKRRIDTARDILVGKVPDPKSQVEQITIALIYKFMDDMDAEAEELGGERKFFTGTYARYGWAQLMSAGWAGTNCSACMARASAKMPENPGIPAVPRHLQERLPAVPRPGNAQELPENHQRIQLRPQRAPGRRLRVPAVGAGQPGRRRAVPHAAPHHRLHGRGASIRRRPKSCWTRLRHGRLPDFGLETHPAHEHRRSRAPAH
jgi:hypothetical protein